MPGLLGKSSVPSGKSFKGAVDTQKAARESRKSSPMIEVCFCSMLSQTYLHAARLLQITRIMSSFVKNTFEQIMDEECCEEHFNSSSNIVSQVTQNTVGLLPDEQAVSEGKGSSS
ncbi:histone H2B-like [Castor canadensis]|jgi:hypothetical protein|uniref:Histone H2B-like n=1 Tax=Castor canadensis TaxID=51338 RepID=A0AC58NH10_CASCN